jgi:hypothetical protein
LWRAREEIRDKDGIKEDPNLVTSLVKENKKLTW